MSSPSCSPQLPPVAGRPGDPQAARVMKSIRLLGRVAGLLHEAATAAPGRVDRATSSAFPRKRVEALWAPIGAGSWDQKHARC